MKYLVMENHKAFSVVIDEDGRILQVANLGYTLGQTVTEVIPFERKSMISKKALATISGFAACFVLAFVSFLSLTAPFTPYANVYLRVNPQVKLVVNEKNRVGEVEALNGDGAKLLFDYAYQRKTATVVLDELLDKAVSMGMLKEGGAIAVDIDGADQGWVAASQLAYEENITKHMAEKMSVTIVVKSYTPTTEQEGEGTGEPPEAGQVTVPQEKVEGDGKKPVDEKMPRNLVNDDRDDGNDDRDDDNNDDNFDDRDDDNDDDNDNNDDDDNDDDD